MLCLEITVDTGNVCDKTCVNTFLFQKKKTFTDKWRHAYVMNYNINNTIVVLHHACNCLQLFEDVKV